MKLHIKMAVHEFKSESCVRGYHKYEDMWTLTIGENPLTRS